MIIHTPSTLAECSDVMRKGERITFIGGGTEQSPGPPVDAEVHTKNLTRIVEYAPSDMVMTVEAGVTLARLQETARAERQRLALDPPQPDRATIGGLVATGAYGPRRARYGAIRDLIIGVTMVRADGVVARGGGKVVKNVAGFDLPKVACGSLGTLGMIATATFRLHPLPEATSTVRFDALAADRVFALVKSVRDAQLEPSSVVAVRTNGAYDVGFRFEGFAKGVEQQTERILKLGNAVRDDDSFWKRHDAVREGGSLRVKIASLPSKFAEVDKTIAPILGALRHPAFAWYATLGLGFLSGEVDDAAALTQSLLATRRSLSLTVQSAPPELALDPWGPTTNAFPIMEQLKLRFDPDRRLNPGRFVGGL